MHNCEIRLRRGEEERGGAQGGAGRGGGQTIYSRTRDVKSEYTAKKGKGLVSLSCLVRLTFLQKTFAPPQPSTPGPAPLEIEGWKSI